MKSRLVKRIILSFLLGGITTVVVAWGATILVTRGFFMWGQTHTAVHYSPEQHWEILGWSRTTVSLRFVAMCSDHKKGVRHANPTGEEWDDEKAAWFELPDDVSSIYRHKTESTRGAIASGWPVVALSFGVDFDNNARVEEGLLISSDNYRYVFPFRPYWTGIVIDTSLYAVLWFGVFLLISKGRQVRRRRKNLCVECGYALRDLERPGCPECGWNRATNNSTATPDPPR